MSDRDPWDALEDAVREAAGSAFLVDQIVTHGEHIGNPQRALHHANRLLVADMAALSKAFENAYRSPAPKRRARRRAITSSSKVVPLRRLGPEDEQPDGAA